MIEFQGAITPTVIYSPVANAANITYSFNITLNTDDDLQDSVDAIAQEMDRRNGNIGFIIGKGLRELYDASASAVSNMVQYLESCKVYENSYWAKAKQLFLGQSPVEQAILANDLTCVKELLKETDFYQHSSQGKPLWSLITQVSTEMADFILDNLSLLKITQYPVSDLKATAFECLIPTLDNRISEKLIEKFQREKVKPSQLPFNGARALILAAGCENAVITNYLLSLDIDVNQKVVIPELKVEATPHQVALVSNKTIKKLFRQKRKGTEPLIEETKNPWTTEFEKVITLIASENNQVEYVAVTNEFGNTFYNPVINGNLYPMHEIIAKMDWRQVTLDGDKLSTKIADATHNIAKWWWHNIADSYVTRYILSSFDINAFLMGEDQFLDLTPSTITNYWLLSAGVASQLNNKGSAPDENEVVCRGQSQVDRAVRRNHVSFVSTSTEPSVCKRFQKDDPILVFDTNHGIDLKTDNGQFEHVVLPTRIHGYQTFKALGNTYNLAQTEFDNTQVDAPDESCYLASDKTHEFEFVIQQIVNNTGFITTQPQINPYGQIYYNVVINNVVYDMYDIISHTDWSQIQLSEATLSSLSQSKYRFWDEQTYTNHYTTRSSAQLVHEPIKLFDINRSLNLVNRAEVPVECSGRSCDYSQLYQQLNDVDKALIFQYTSTSSKALNSFLKGNDAEFKGNIAEHQNRWSVSPELNNSGFDITDPLQWWVYSARFAHALNKIQPSTSTDGFCRGQTHKDRHLRTAHPAPISASTDFNLCHSYVPANNEGELVIMNGFEGKDITALSFHPEQREFVQPPALLVEYKRKQLFQNKRGQLEASVISSKAKGKERMPLGFEW